MTGSGGAGGLYALAAGIGMVAFGVVLAGDLRGAAERWNERPAGTGPGTGTGTIPGPRRKVRATRLLGAVFALAGAAVLALGTVLTARGEPYVDPPRLPDPLLPVLVAMAAALTWMNWRRNGSLRRDWTGGGTARRTAAVLTTAGLYAFLAGLGSGLQLLWLAGWVLGGAGQLLVLLTAGPVPAPSTISGKEGE
ncbi:hypothetical protein [Streptomyces sp. NPDC048659]|uniref:hypothetical protein n=1 Tax=Streptomyces sp. NPDC048659 TaxID=3155489 RepID=UPI00343FF4E6